MCSWNGNFVELGNQICSSARNWLKLLSFLKFVFQCCYHQLLQPICFNFFCSENTSKQRQQNSKSRVKVSNNEHTFLLSYPHSKIRPTMVGSQMLSSTSSSLYLLKSYQPTNSFISLKEKFPEKATCAEQAVRVQKSLMAIKNLGVLWIFWNDNYASCIKNDIFRHSSNAFNISALAR